MKWYLSGPMRGIPGCNYAKFDTTARRLRAEGYAVINPTEVSAIYGTAEELAHNPTALAAAMEAELKMIPDCDAIYLLRDWERSEGARAELACALQHNLKIMLEVN